MVVFKSEAFENANLCALAVCKTAIPAEPEPTQTFRVIWKGTVIRMKESPGRREDALSGAVLFRETCKAEGQGLTFLYGVPMKGTCLKLFGS